MHAGIKWQASTRRHPARDVALVSMTAVVSGAKAEWLALFAPDATVEDPVGASPLDPEGRGHHGIAAITAFWESTIAQADRIEFHIRDSFAAGYEVANTGCITTYLPDGNAMDAEGVFVYRVTEQATIGSLRAFWEFERAMTTLRPAS